MSKDITVIIPVHELSETTKPLFDNAIKSIVNQVVKPRGVMIVSPKGGETFEYLKSYDYGEINSIVTQVENDGETDFASQLNLGVSKCDTKWFSLLELDDEYSTIWFKNVSEYIDKYEDVKLFLPMIVDVDSDSNFIGFTNEAVWANSFSDELGFLDKEALLSYQQFNIDGMVMDRESFINLGGIKKNIKLTFIYEFLLRMTYNSVKTMVIPKLGYKHLNQREGSLFNNYKKTIDSVEAKWWLNKAKNEFYHTNDRELSYQ